LQEQQRLVIVISTAEEVSTTTFVQPQSMHDTIMNVFLLILGVAVLG
jgi:hypothetical protein